VRQNSELVVTGIQRMQMDIRWAERPSRAMNRETRQLSHGCWNQRTQKKRFLISVFTGAQLPGPISFPLKG
jgi:hypothetical protein